MPRSRSGDQSCKESRTNAAILRKTHHAHTTEVEFLSFASVVRSSCSDIASSTRNLPCPEIISHVEDYTSYFRPRDRHSLPCLSIGPSVVRVLIGETEGVSALNSIYTAMLGVFQRVK